MVFAQRTRGIINPSFGHIGYLAKTDLEIRKITLIKIFQSIKALAKQLIPEQCWYRILSKAVAESDFKLAKLKKKSLILENRNAVYLKYMSRGSQKINFLWPA